VIQERADLDAYPMPRYQSIMQKGNGAKAHHAPAMSILCQWFQSSSHVAFHEEGKERKMKFRKSFSIVFIAAFAVLFACNKNSTDSKSFTPRSGSWSGSGISFTVGGSPLSVSSLKFSYSGRASGSYCSFSYTSTTTLMREIKIEDNAFSYSSSDYEIEGSFTDETHASVTVEWDLYDSYCRAYYSGSKDYTASYSGASKAIGDLSSEAETADGLIEISNDETATFMKKEILECE